mgnify:CR=1 FL=1
MYYTNKIDTILFDMDGTVLASEDIFGISEQRLLESYGINVELDALIEFRGLSIEAFYPQFIAKFNLDDSIEVVQNKLQAILYQSFSSLDSNNFSFSSSISFISSSIYTSQF